MEKVYLQNWCIQKENTLYMVAMDFEDIQIVTTLKENVPLLDVKELFAEMYDILKALHI